MTIYAITGVLDEEITLGITLSETTAEEVRDRINKNGGIGYCCSKVWIEEYNLNGDDYLRFN